MAQSHYQEQFKTVLGSGAWPGTLNVDILEDEINTYQKLRVIAGLEQGENSSETESIRIAGFEREGRSFGGATAFPASISSDGEHWINCAILIPDLTRHTETAEVISSSFLRERLPCSDGDLVTLRLG
jgi:CTP-dependent riboflavin kinase